MDAPSREGGDTSAGRRHSSHPSHAKTFPEPKMQSNKNHENLTHPGVREEAHGVLLELEQRLPQARRHVREPDVPHEAEEIVGGREVRQGRLGEELRLADVVPACEVCGGGGGGVTLGRKSVLATSITSVRGCCARSSRLTTVEVICDQQCVECVSNAPQEGVEAEGHNRVKGAVAGDAGRRVGSEASLRKAAERPRGDVRRCLKHIFSSRAAPVPICCVQLLQFLACSNISWWWGSVDDVDSLSALSRSSMWRRCRERADGDTRFRERENKRFSAAALCLATPLRWSDFACLTQSESGR